MLRSSLTWRLCGLAAPLLVGLHDVEGVSAVDVRLARDGFSQLVVVLVHGADGLLETPLRRGHEDAGQVDLAPSPLLASPLDRARGARAARRDRVEVDRHFSGALMR